MAPTSNDEPPSYAMEIIRVTFHPQQNARSTKQRIATWHRTKARSYAIKYVRLAERTNTHVAPHSADAWEAHRK